MRPSKSIRLLLRRSQLLFGDQALHELRSFLLVGLDPSVRTFRTPSPFDARGVYTMLLVVSRLVVMPSQYWQTGHLKPYL